MDLKLWLHKARRKRQKERDNMFHNAMANKIGNTHVELDKKYESMKILSGHELAMLMLHKPDLRLELNEKLRYIKEMRARYV